MTDRQQCINVLLELERQTMLYGCGIVVIGESTEPPLRYHVTRRGNVYDNTLHVSVLHTWGMGTASERRAIAERWIEENT